MSHQTSTLPPDLRLVTGDPSRKAASFTRFVLPITYEARPMARAAAAGTPAFVRTQEPADEPGPLGRERWKYFTPEISEVLFEHASWWTFDPGATLHKPRPDWAWRGALRVTDGIGCVPFRVSRPRLVLFEWNDGVPHQFDLFRTGLLVLDLWFPEADDGAPVPEGGRPFRLGPTLDHLLDINESFRFWREPWDGHRAGFVEALCDCEVAPVGGAGERARWIGSPDVEDPYGSRWLPWLTLPLKDGESAYRLSPADANGAAQWVAHADDRAFTWTCAVLSDGANTIRRTVAGWPDDRERGPAFKALNGQDAHLYGHWVKLLNVDRAGDHPHQTSPFERGWAEARTYHRWEADGTWYGFTSHSGALVAPPFGNPPLWKHFGGLYFDQTLLLLYLRVTIFRVSHRLNDISSRPLRDPHTSPAARPMAMDEWRREFKKLRWAFTLFTNLYQFPLLSNQQQGVEMFALQKQQMDVTELFDEVQREISESHEFLDMEAQEVDRRAADRLSRLGPVLGVVGVVAGLAQIVHQEVWDKSHRDLWWSFLTWLIPPLGKFPGMGQVAAGTVIEAGVLVGLSIVAYRGVAWWLRRREIEEEGRTR
jgi:hypothetical protein